MSENPNRARDHLANERTFLAWMRTVLAMMGFAAAREWVIIYSSDYSKPLNLHAHVRHRQFSAWVAENAKDWSLWRKVDNRYPLAEGEIHSEETSHADFYFFRRNAADKA